MERSFKSVFITRNEFQALEQMLPEQTVHFTGLVDECTARVRETIGTMDAFKKKL
jgi:hypothetical protein